MNIQARYGRMVVLDNDQIASRALRLYGEWAQHELELLRHFIRPGMTVVDGGAYIGSHTLAFAAFVGPGGRVHAFEAYPDFFALLQQNVRANGGDNVVCHACALAAREATALVPAIALDAAGNFGGSSFLQAAEAADATGGTVPIAFRRLDAEVADAVDIIKLDIEGMEALALRGAAALLARARPVVFSECNSLDAGAAVIEVMRQAGYVGFGCLTQAFNSGNFNANAENIFGAAQEAGLLFVHAARMAEFSGTVEDLALPRIERLDDLALLLLHKPQYPAELLAGLAVARRFGLAYPSPLAAARAQEVAELSARAAAREAVVAEAEAAASARAGEIDDLSARLAATEAARADAAALAEARAGEIATLAERVSVTETALTVQRAQLADAGARLADTEEALRRATWWWRWLVRRR